MVGNFYLRAYGCQMNQYDAGLVAQILLDAGYKSVSEPSEADIILFLGCSVRRHAESRVLGRLASLKHRNGSKLVGILGCTAQRLGRQLIERGADLAVGPDEYEDLPQLITSYRATRSPQLATRLTGASYDKLMPLPYSRSRVFAPIVIMRGCNNYCSYCVVPYLRGLERSRNHRLILEEARKLEKIGVKEICLVGQNVLAYKDAGVDFVKLLWMLNELKEIERIRFITAHPRDLSRETILELSQIPKLCEYFHLPIQSGSDRILELMNRGYTRKEYLARIELLRALIPKVAISTDLIVGFPTETDLDFTETLKLVEEVRYDFAYMYCYSPRPGTKAAGYPQVEPEVSHQRLTQLIALQNRHTKNHLLGLIGQVVEVLVEGPAPRDKKMVFGRTRTNKGVVLPGPANPGELVKVRVQSVSGWTAQGIPIHSEEVL